MATSVPPSGQALPLPPTTTTTTTTAAAAERAGAAAAPRFRAFWQTRAPGSEHPTATRPATALRADTSRGWHSSSVGMGWDTMHLFDEAAADIFRTHGLEAIDVAHALSYREDGHPPAHGSQKTADGLHYCIPGPPDVYNAVLALALSEKQ